VSGEEPRGYQWLIDPSGHRWKVVGFNNFLACLEDAEGREINVGRHLLASGGWQEAEFEVVEETPAERERRELHDVTRTYIPPEEPRT
jgi:hypothetical protein